MAELQIEITKEGVLKQIEALKAGKARGPDGIAKNHLAIEPDITASILVCILKLFKNNSQRMEACTCYPNIRKRRQSVAIQLSTGVTDMYML